MNKKYVFILVLLALCAVGALLGVAKKDELKCYAKDAQSCLNVGMKYFENSHDPVAQKYFKKSCDLKSAYACYNLGVMFDNGFGVAKMEPEAIRYYTKACDSGYAPACVNLSYIYYDSLVYSNTTQAIELAKKACDLGEGSGCYNLGF